MSKLLADINTTVIRTSWLFSGKYLLKMGKMSRTNCIYDDAEHFLTL